MNEGYPIQGQGTWFPEGLVWLVVTALGIPDLRFVLMILCENPGCFMNKLLSCESNCLKNTIGCFGLLVFACECSVRTLGLYLDGIHV